MAALVLEEYELLGDARYRSYVSAIDKALKSFEYTSEWADLISALGKLSKVLVNHTKYQVIPRRITISKRLAQCMHPALPSGVHLKALETYDIIFKSIGSTRLSQELFIYSAGLFPLLANAAMNVKPSLLTIYETHFVPLGEKLRPGLNGFLIGILPGLEEGSDYYERTDSLLQKVCDEVEKSYFYGCMWKCVLSNPTIRLPGISFIINHFNRRLSMEDQLYIIGTDIDSMVHGLCTSLQDTSVLVQRCALDLLLLGFPIHNNQLVASDMVRIVTSAVTVVLRRDMSLNRRLFSWLLGGDLLNTSEENSSNFEKTTLSEMENDCAYFKTHSKDLLLQALQVCFDNPVSMMPPGGASSGSPDLWCYRLLISLLDRPEISSIILDDVLIEVFRSLYIKCQLRQLSSSTKLEKKGSRTINKDSSELIKTANLLFATLEPWYLWAYSARLFESACKDPTLHSAKSRSFSSTDDGSSDIQKVGSGLPTISEICIILNFLLDVVSLETYLEARSEHLPDLLCRIADALSESCQILPAYDITSTLNLCSKILSKVQAPMINVDEIESRNASIFIPKATFASMSSHNSTVVTVSNNDARSEEGSIKDFSNDDNSVNNIATDHKDGTQNNAFPPSSLVTGITNCMMKFQLLFVNFVKFKMLIDLSVTLDRFEKLLLSNQPDQLLRENTLKRILHTCLDAKCDCISSSSVEVFKHDITENILQASQVNGHLFDESIPNDFTLSEAFKKLCHVIVELSSFPTCCTNTKKIFDNHFDKTNEKELPQWLKLLVSIACFGSLEDVFFTSLSTLFDLIALTKSMSSHSDPNSSHLLPSPGSYSKQTVVSIFPIPIMTSSQLGFLSEKTSLFPVAAAKLWKYIGDNCPNYSLRGTELLQHVHNLSPSSSVCEAVICRSMRSGDEMEQIQSQKKFCILWHLTRDLSIKSTPPSSIKAFDQCFFLMLDNLGKETGPQKAIAQAWLNHSLQRGDVARFLEPILLLLLHPDSARVSIQHVNVHCPKKVTISEESGKNQSIEEFEAKIYAISSISGNVIYHVSDDNHPSSRHVSPQKKIFALTSVVNSGGNKSSPTVTQNSMFKEFEQPSSHERDLQLPISLFVNPFGSLSSFGSDSHLDSLNMPDLSQAKRITVIRKSSFDEDEIDNSIPTIEKSTEASVESIVSNLVSDIVDAVVKSVDGDASDKESSGDYNVGEEYTYLANSYIGNDNVDFAKESHEPKSRVTEVTVHPFHTYLLLYSQVYDSQKTLYALYSLKAIVLTNPRIILCSMAATSISNSLSYRGQQLQVLLTRHRKSVFGNNFHGELTAEGTTMYRSSTFVETVVLACLYHIRSYYPNLPQVRLTEEEVFGNRNVRLLCMEVLTLVFSELVGIVKDSGKSIASYLNDLLLRSKVQKTLLHCLVASVYDSQKHTTEYGKITFTETIVDFNDHSFNTDESNGNGTNDFQDTFQVHLLRLMATLIVLEDTISSQLSIEKDNRPGSIAKTVDFLSDRHISGHSHISSSKYQQGIPISAQSMFLSAVLTALNHQHHAHMHTHWLSLVTSALPFAGRWLTRLVMMVILQLCSNLEDIATSFFDKERNEAQATQHEVHMPPDYIITIVEGLTILCHYCLLDPPVSNLLNQTPMPPVPSQPYAPGPSASQIISNLIHVFSASSNEKNGLSIRDSSSAMDPVMTARRALLSNLPRIIASLSSIYQIIVEVDKDSEHKAWWIMGTPKIVKQHILSFLSPISLNYGTNFMAAMAVIWHDRRAKGSSQTRKVIPVWSSDQLLLVNLVSAIKVLPIETIVQTVRSVLKQPPSVAQMNRVPVEVSTLQVFLAYMQCTSGSQLVESWQSLLGLLRDGLQITSPPVQFHLLAILHEFVQRAPILEDKKAQKDLQDIAHKLIEACSTVACASLEQTTWLWRNLAVRPGPQTDILTVDGESEDACHPIGPVVKTTAFQPNGFGSTQNFTQIENKQLETANISDTSSVNLNADAQYSVQALSILAEFLAHVLDFVYIGEEKDKVVPLLSNIMYYVTPYLKNRSPHNAPSFRACCQLLSSISGYQHTRKAWRKDAFELLLDTAFFQMSPVCINYWRAIIDHLMTHDKTTFRDFMARVSVAQSGSLNLFSSKEQEYEQRAHLLKRLAFVLFCSELDQYQKFMPDIQERLTECLRLPHVPLVHAEVFLCFRVLLIRMSPQHVTSLWPMIITEMVQLFTQIEYELCTDSEEFSGGGLRKLPSSHIRRLSNLDSSWVTNTCNGLNAHNNPAWFHLYLSACKLVDMAVALPANLLPQFQMYRWAFIGDSPPLSSENNNVKEKLQKPGVKEFVPHVKRLAKLLNKKEPCENYLPFVPGLLLLTVPSIQSLQQLQPFFNTLSDITYSQNVRAETREIFLKPPEKKNSILKSRSAPELYTLCQRSSISHWHGNTSTIEQIENVLEMDFIENQISS